MYLNTESINLKSKYETNEVSKFLDKFNLPFLSYPVAIAKTSSPTLTTSLTLATLLVSSCDTWIRASQPGHNSTNAPKSWIDTTLHG